MYTEKILKKRSFIEAMKSKFNSCIFTEVKKKRDQKKKTLTVFVPFDLHTDKRIKREEDEQISDYEPLCHQLEANF